MIFFRKTRLILLTSFLLLAGCGRKTGDTSKIKLQLDLPNLEYSSLSEPSNLSEFDCFGILLIHPNESQNLNQCQITSATGSAAASIRLPYQQFLGGFFKGDPIEFEVANGRDRSLQLVGFKTNFGANIQQARDACAKYSQQRLTTFSQLYRLGQSEKFDILPGATTNVSIPATFTATTSQVVTSCFGTAPPTTTPTSGPPVLARLTLQDGITTIMQNVCVGGMLELVDSAGQRANVTEDIQIQLATGNLGSRFYRNFEQCFGGSGSAAPILNFYDIPGRLNQIPIFFKPGSASADPINLLRVTGPATLMTEDLGLLTLTQAAPLAAGENPSLQIFDSLSNRSTADALPANPIPVKSEQCRSAQVQLVGDAKPPHEMLVDGTGTTLVTISAVKVGPGQIRFFTSKDCSTTANFDSILLSITPGIPKPYVAEFSYIIPSNIFPNFTLSANITFTATANYNGIITIPSNSNNSFRIVD